MLLPFIDGKAPLEYSLRFSMTAMTRRRLEE
jgi:hypothetical protein